MRFSPALNEYAAIDAMTEGELLEYFITRTFETEEVWGLASEAGWVMRERDGHTILPVWPFQQLVAPCEDESSDHSANAISLERFVYRVLDMLTAAKAQVEVMPRRSGPGSLIEPRQLRSLFQGVIDAGEYRLEG